MQRARSKELKEMLSYIRNDANHHDIQDTQLTDNSSTNFSSDINTVVSDSVLHSKTLYSETESVIDLRHSTTQIDKYEEEEPPAINHDVLSLSSASTCDFLRQFSLKHNITHRALRDLLGYFSKKLPLESIPLDPRSLLETPRNSSLNIKDLSGGKYAHFGLKKHVLTRLNNGLLAHKETDFTNMMLEKYGNNFITISVGTDGIPITRSTNKQFWPILGILDQSVNKEPFVIGLYYGSTKPSNTDFLLDFINECEGLERNGIHFRECNYIVRISKILADAPARSFIKSIKNHNSYYSCERCTQEGVWSGRVVYPYNINSPRTDESFRAKRDIEHHSKSGTILQDSIFSRLQVGLISQIPLDYLHLVCLGVVRKLFRQWVKGKLPHRIKSRDTLLISCRLISYKKFFPNNFQRKPRSLLEIDNYKGTEFRTLLLYSGVGALKGIISKQRYRHFLYLHSALYILLSERAAVTEWNNLARALLHKFVELAQTLYGIEFIVYNVHGLCHLADDSKLYGALDNASTFPFENFMQKIKRIIRSKNNYLEQACNRLIEMEKMSSKVFSYTDIPFRLSCRLGDCCFWLMSDRIVLIKNFLDIEKGLYECQEYKVRQNVKDYPIKSHLLGIFQVSDLSEKFSLRILVNDVKLKLFRIPYEASYICIPLLHTYMTC